MGDKRPNFLLIMTDQQRGDCLSIDGHPVLLTPNMDSIAGSGARFRHAYSTCPVCIPARRSLMTGRFPTGHGMVGYAENVEWHAPPTLPGVLRDAGYQTALVGRSMHLSPPRKRYGFESMVTLTIAAKVTMMRGLRSKPRVLSPTATATAPCTTTGRRAPGRETKRSIRQTGQSIRL